MKLLFKRSHPDATVPTRAYSGDAGFDLYCCEDMEIGPDEFKDIPTGISVALPEGVWAEITGRSSTIRSKGLLVTHGVIDQGWRGELFAGVRNLNDSTVMIEKNERLAQLIPHRLVANEYEWIEVDELPASERGTKGFGSSGR